MEMPSRVPVPIKISTSSSVHTCECDFLLQLKIQWCLSLKRVLRKEQQLFSKIKSPNCSIMLVINFSISWIYLESSCFCFTHILQKITNFVLNDLSEDIKLFLERASSDGQIKSSRLCFSPWSFTFKSLQELHYVSQNLNSFIFFIISLKSWKCLSFSSHLVDFPQKK